MKCHLNGTRSSVSFTLVVSNFISSKIILNLIRSVERRLGHHRIGTFFICLINLSARVFIAFCLPVSHHTSNQFQAFLTSDAVFHLCMIYCVSSYSYSCYPIFLFNTNIRKLVIIFIFIEFKRMVHYHHR